MSERLLFDIFQGIGIAAAAGIRPFLPAVVASVLGLVDLQIHFDHSHFAFIQRASFLIVVAVLAVALVVWEGSRRGAEVDRGPGAWFSAACGAAVGALVFAGVLAHQGDTWWPGIVGGIVCAGLGFLCFRPFLVRLRSRLDAEAASVGVPLVAEGAALVVGVTSALLPPAGVVAAVALIVVWVLGRRRGEAKYAGLRILR